jgi:uncharacterized protein (TIGR02453 family)
MAFKGWKAEALEFYEGLEADNSKAYWTANKHVYEEMVSQPMAELLAELGPDYGEGKIFRPYRDVRFSADKTPYKTAIGATLSRGGYIQFSAEGLSAGSGMWMMAADQLERYRAAVDEDGPGTALEAIVAEGKKAGIEISGHDSLKSAPRGYPKDHPRVDLLRYKGLISWQSWPVAPWLGTAAAKKRVVEFFEASRPMKDWLNAHVGESQLPPRER